MVWWLLVDDESLQCRLGDVDERDVQEIGGGRADKQTTHLQWMDEPRSGKRGVGGTSRAGR